MQFLTKAVVFAVGATTLPAQTLTTLYRFNTVYGEYASGALTQGPHANFYGATYGGPNASGTFFKINSKGVLSTLYAFSGPYPAGALVLATDGDFYGAAAQEVFKITPDGTPTTLYTFCSHLPCPDGMSPLAGLIQAADGNLYGTTSAGGAGNNGTVFKMTTDGEIATLYSFCPQGGCPRGGGPQAGLVQGSDGDLYGTTLGTVFKISTAGKFTSLFESGQTGDSFYAGLVQGADGEFYGTTYDGGAHGLGMVFKITSNGKLTILYSFCAESGCVDGSGSRAGLVQATDGNFYGTTMLGGAGYGTLFKISSGGLLTQLHVFCAEAGCLDGGLPMATLVEAKGGALYGSTSNWQSTACDSPCGTIFKLTP